MKKINNIDLEVVSGDTEETPDLPLDNRRDNNPNNYAEFSSCNHNDEISGSRGKTLSSLPGTREGEWVWRYLMAFCRTWIILFLSTAVCSTLGQTHFLRSPADSSMQFVQYSRQHQQQQQQSLFNNQQQQNLSLTSSYHFAMFSRADHLYNRSRNLRNYSYRIQMRNRRRLRMKLNNSSVTSLSHNRRTTPKSPVTLALVHISKRWLNNDQEENSFARLKSENLNPGSWQELENFSQNVVSAQKPRNVRRSVVSDHFYHRDHHFPIRKTSQAHPVDESNFQNDGYQAIPDVEEDGDASKPCVYSGHLKTDRNWYGYLANISLAGGTGRIVFEFSYPAESCCLNILFYYEDQLSIMTARTNCWQKEDLLRPEADQILRLTPSFSWSGCQVRRKTGSPDMMLCKGGRSFASHNSDFYSAAKNDKSETEERLIKHRERHGNVASNAAVWYVAVSNCASLRGLNLRYKLKVYGHSIPCGAEYGSEDEMSSDKEVHRSSKGHKPATKNSDDSTGQEKDVDNEKAAPSSASASSFSYQSHRPSDAAHTHLASDDWPVCTIEGSVNTTHSWFGFIKNLSLVDGGGFRFYFSLPYSMTPMNVLLYHDEDIRKLHWEQICWLKESVIESKHVLERIIDLTSRSTDSGCASKTGANIEGNNLTCRGEKIFSGERNIYIALGNCRSRDGLLLRYKLEVFGYKDNTICSGIPSNYCFIENSRIFCLCIVFLHLFHSVMSTFY